MLLFSYLLLLLYYYHYYCYYFTYYCYYKITYYHCYCYYCCNMMLEDQLQDWDTLPTTLVQDFQNMAKAVLRWCDSSRLNVCAKHKTQWQVLINDVHLTLLYLHTHHAGRSRTALATLSSVDGKTWQPIFTLYTKLYKCI